MKDEFQSQLSAAQAIPIEDVKDPNMPVDVYVQEAEDLYHWAQDDKAVLTGANLDWALVDALRTRAGALREAQSLWNKTRNTSSETGAEWNTKSKAAFEFRNDLLADFRYAYRNDPDLLERVSYIAEGDENSDMVQDLNDLSVLGKANTAPLENINLDLAKLDKAAELANEMGDLLGKVNGDRKSANEAKVLRDRFYTHLKAAVDEVRDCGKYKFRKDDSRLKGYVSSYIRRKY